MHARLIEMGATQIHHENFAREDPMAISPRKMRQVKTKAKRAVTATRTALKTAGETTRVGVASATRVIKAAAKNPKARRTAAVVVGAAAVVATGVAVNRARKRR
jgi:hypothetical protein